MTIRTLFVLFDQVDLLDVGGPYEVFLTANRLAERHGDPAPFSVASASVDGAPVTAYGGLMLAPTAFELDETYDLVVVPGAVDLDLVSNDAAVMAFIVELVTNATLRATVCTGSLLLGRAGLLADREWTTHWEDVVPAGDTFGKAGTEGKRWVDDGDLVTSAGLSSGIAMGLHLVSRLVSLDLATKVANQIEYTWDPTGAR